MATQICTALNLSDESKCNEQATSSNGLFCAFHSRQCYGLYRGYKIRNAKLDAMDRSPPEYLAKVDKALRNENFTSIEDEKTLNELHKFLFKKHALLDRVIRARKLHHSRFYSLNLDYGHKAFLDKLTNDKFIVLRALERLERRTAEVLYAQQRWFKWVRNRQDEEEAARAKESETVKKEAKLFQRHWKEVEARLKEKRRKEDEKRQAAFLDAAYEDRLKQLDEEAIEEAWDPIEDAVEDERYSFVDLMKHLLWLEGAQERSRNDHSRGTNGSVSGKIFIATTGKEIVSHEKPQSRNAKKRAKAKAKEDAAEGNGAVKAEVNETREEMRDRLVSGVRYQAGEGITGMMVAGTIENPIETRGRVSGMPADEVEKILEEVAEIKLFLFCRILLSQAALLPAALRAGSVEQFLMDAEVTTADLRDLCLKIEQPSLQEIRDACADFFRGDVDHDDDEEPADASEDEAEDDRNLSRLKHKNVPDTWRSAHEEEVDSRKQALQFLKEDANTTIEFGEIEDGQFKNKKIRVQLCGKTIWNYPSDKALSRKGWLHYSIIAKGSKLTDAIELCRNWDEFWELNVLSIFKYFPSPHWEQWAGNQMRQQMLQLGFIPYLEYSGAEEATVSRTAGGRSQGPRVHAAVESKNIIGAHIKRNDPVSRRLVQYLAMQPGCVVLLVRDAKTGKILVTPPEEHTWLVRDKAGHGRASRTEWNVRMSVNERLFEQVSGGKVRDWQFGFTEYYDVIVWDLCPGEPYEALYRTVQEALRKARRCCSGLDMYEPMTPIMRTLKRDRPTGRTSDAQSGDETIYDEIAHGGVKLFYRTTSGAGRTAEVKEESPVNWFYSDIDAAEDIVLFPEETQGNVSSKIADRPDKGISNFERSGPNWKRFVLDLDSSDDSDDFEDVDLSGLKTAPKSKSDSKKKTKRARRPKPSKEQLVINEDEDDEVVLGDQQCLCDRCIRGEYEHCEAWEDEGHELDPEDILFDTSDGDPETLRIALALERIEPDRGWGEDPQRDFMRYLDREKSKLFKRAWHDAVIDSDERAVYEAANALIESLSRTMGPRKRKEVKYCLDILVWLRVHYLEHRLVWKDITRAYTAMSIFFESGLQQQNQDDDSVIAKTREKISDNAGRANLIVYGRTFQSNMTLPRAFWGEVDAVYERERDERRRGRERGREEHTYNRDWDSVVRPLLAHFFKAGVIAPGHIPYPPGHAAVVAEPGKDPNLYIDYRFDRPNWPSPSQDMRNIPDPYTIDILGRAQKWRGSRPQARFALLRIWTHSHFYPLMLGLDNRPYMSFDDVIGRVWEWKFVPKDMPGSEWSMQKSVELRIDPFHKQFGKQVVVKRDMLLVMAKNEEELKRLAVAVTFAVQTDPWRLEIDLWKSFVNVDLNFLAGLDSVWLE